MCEDVGNITKSLYCIVLLFQSINSVDSGMSWIVYSILEPRFECMAGQMGRSSETTSKIRLFMVEIPNFLA